jgi:hypothetical protein
VTKRDASAAWELGDLLTAQGSLTRSAPIELRRLPPVEDVSISDGYLSWTMRKPDRVIDGAAIYKLPIASTRERLDPKIRARNEKDMLRRFADLHSMTDQEILEFARTWGVLKLCEHGLPYQHPPLALYRLRIPPPDARLAELLAAQRAQRSLPVRGVCSALRWEPLQTWRFFSRQANAILDIAACIHAGKHGSEGDWVWVVDGGLPWHPPSAAMTVNRTYLLEALRGWTSLGMFHPSVWDLDGKIHLAGSDLFAKLAVELALAACRSKGLQLCSVCGRQYEADRKPAVGRENYCGEPACQREGARRRKANSRRGSALTETRQFPHP